MSKPKPISQAEARRLRREVARLQGRLAAVTSAYGCECPGTHLTTAIPNKTLAAILRTAKQLGHAVIVRIDGNVLRYYAAEKQS